MNNFRVVVNGNSGDGFLYRIEDVHKTDAFPSAHEVEPFVKHGPYGLCCASSIEDLKKRLRELLVACDKPAMYLTRQELREQK